MSRFHWTLLATAVAVAAAMATGHEAWAVAALAAAMIATGLGVSFPSLQFFGRCLCRGRTDGRLATLTFDDGPDPDNTPALLDLLAQRGVKAVFFCIGEQVEKHPELARRIVEEGHAVENHTQRHSPMTNLFSARRLREELGLAQVVLERATGRAPAWFRPPVGLTNPRVFAVARSLGLSVVGYTVRGLDRKPQPAERVVARLLRGLRPGAVLLLHDRGVERSRLLETVGLLLDKLESAGYRCVHLEELVSHEQKNA